SDAPHRQPLGGGALLVSAAGFDARLRAAECCDPPARGIDFRSSEQVGPRAVNIVPVAGHLAETLARRADMSTGTYARIETGKTNPTFTTLVAIAEALEGSLVELARQVEAEGGDG